MKRFYVAVVILIIAVSTIGCGLSTARTTSRDITVVDAYGQIQDNVSNPDFMIIDVRTPAEYAEGHIEDAINIDYYAATFRADIEKLDSNDTYLVYCRTGNRSKGAIDLMKELKFRDVYHMFEGITEWINEGYPVVK